MKTTCIVRVGGFISVSSIRARCVNSFSGWLVRLLLPPTLTRRVLLAMRVLARVHCILHIVHSPPDSGDAPNNQRTLQKRLGAWDLVFYGVGSTVGAGIYSLVGPGLKEAG